MAKEKLTQSEIDGVQYRRAKLWQIILVACNALNGMTMLSLLKQGGADEESIRQLNRVLQGIKKA